MLILAKLKLSEKKGVFSEGSAVIPGLAGAGWSDWQTPHLLWLSFGGVAVLSDEQIPWSMLVEQYLQAKAALEGLKNEF